jgi:hypothetical protein
MAAGFVCSSSFFFLLLLFAIQIKVENGVFKIIPTKEMKTRRKKRFSTSIDKNSELK